MAEYPGAAWAGVSPNRSDRQGKVRLFIVHHYAGTQDPASARARFMSSNDRSVSPNYQVNADGSVYEIVPPDRYRAWTTGAIDHQAVTCETQNTTGAPTWGISRESHEAIAHLVAWAAQRYGFPIQRGRVDAGDVVAVPGVVGHRETPAGRQTGTACPGPSMDLDWIVNRAQQIAGGSPAGTRKEDDDMPYSEEQLSKIITNAVWGQGGEPAFRPMILNRSSGQSEYPELTLGGMQRRIEAESAPRFLKPVLDAIAGIVEAVFKRPVTRQGGSLKGQTNLEATLAYADANFQAGRDSAKQSVLDAIKTLPTGPGGSVNADAVAEKVAEVFADKLAKQQS